MRAVKGILLECDEAVKQIIKELDNELKFIIHDLDETHLFIDASHIETVKEKLNDKLEENTYRIVD